MSQEEGKVELWSPGEPVSITCSLAQQASFEDLSEEYTTMQSTFRGKSQKSYSEVLLNALEMQDNIATWACPQWAPYPEKVTTHCPCHP